mgnify:CR=1 FL=1
MRDTGASLGHLQALEVLERLPYAVALLEPSGGIGWTNGRFREVFGAPAGVPRELLEQLATLTAGAARLSLPRADRGPVEVLAHCLQSTRFRMLLLDDTPGEVDAAALQSMHARLAELEREATVDRLTGAWNRRYLEHAMPAEASRSRRYRQPLSAVLFDIDHFKRINDRYGHATGDAVLREISALARSRIRAADALVRWGGEEFLVLMPHTAHGAAGIAAEKLRAAIEAHTFPAVGTVTVSLGAAELLAGEDGEAFFKRVDAALYRAKETGRNRVVSDPRGASDAWAGEAPTALMQLVWHPSYACGEPTIDEQHQELFDASNALIQASLEQRANRAAFLEALKRCMESIARHFADEERILAARGYAHLAQHCGAHRTLLERAAALEAGAAKGETGVGVLVEFLVYEVVSRHILKADRDYFPLMGASLS